MAIATVNPTTGLTEMDIRAAFSRGSPGSHRGGRRGGARLLRDQLR